MEQKPKIKLIQKINDIDQEEDDSSSENNIFDELTIVQETSNDLQTQKIAEDVQGIMEVQQNLASILEELHQIILQNVISQTAEIQQIGKNIEQVSTDTNQSTKELAEAYKQSISTSKVKTNFACALLGGAIGFAFGGPVGAAFGAPVSAYLSSVSQKILLKNESEKCEECKQDEQKK